MQDETDTALSHWLSAASRHSGVTRMGECEYANWEGQIIICANESDEQAGFDNKKNFN